MIHSRKPEHKWVHIQGYSKRSINFQKIYFTKTTDAKSMSCVWMERKSFKVLIWISHQVPGAHIIILYAKGCYVQNGSKRTGESFMHAEICQDNVSVKCATTFSDTLWKESDNQEVYLSLVQVWEELDYWFDICHATRGAHIKSL
jgi:hypothetical protein